MKLSVIVPVYNVEKYLRQCLDSIVNQTYKDLEIILVNDGSKDKSGDICREYAEKDNRIIFIDKENGGVVSAYTEGFKYVTSEYVTFVDSDDWIELDMYETLMSKMLDNKDLDLVICKYEKTDGINGKIVDLGVHKDQYVVFENFVYKQNIPHISSSKVNKIYKKVLLGQVLDNIDINCSFAEDCMVVLPYAKIANNMYYIDKLFYHYRINVEGSVSKNVSTKAVDHIIMIYNVWKKYNFTIDEMTWINECILSLEIAYLNNVYQSNAKNKEKYNAVKYLIKNGNFEYFSHNSNWLCFNKKQRIVKYFYKSNSLRYSYIKYRIFKSNIKRVLKRTFLMKIYKKIKKR